MQSANSIPIPTSATRETAQVALSHKRCLLAALVAQSHLRTNGVVVTGSS